MKGFTLIELVLVIALLGIMVIGAQPFLPLSGESLDSASRKVRMDVLYAQERAIITGENHGVNFIVNGNYTIYRGTTANLINDPFRNTLFDEDLAEFQNVSVGTNYQVEFDAHGRPVLGGGGSVTLTNGSDNKGVAVTANTGYVQIQ